MSALCPPVTKTTQIQADTKVYSRDSKLVGKTTGAAHLCSMEGCRGMRIATKWPDNKITFPCTKGLLPHEDGVKIS